jgi:hypothetical protein
MYHLQLRAARNSLHNLVAIKGPYTVPWQCLPGLVTLQMADVCTTTMLHQTSPFTPCLWCRGPEQLMTATAGCPQVTQHQHVGHVQPLWEELFRPDTPMGTPGGLPGTKVDVNSDNVVSVCFLCACRRHPL